MWLDALGLKQWKNHGIWAPDSGSCDIAETRMQECKLPFGSKFYTWGERDKGISNC